MHDAGRDAGVSYCRFVLHLTARVSGHDDVGPVLLELGRLAATQFRRHLRLDEAVNPGGAAAEVRALRFYQAAPGATEQCTWLLGDALRVSEVAGVLVGDPARKAPVWRSGQRREVLCQVSHAN